MTPTIRTFRGADVRGALAAVKSALGPDAVILSTREVKGGMFSKAEVEVTAAVQGASMAPSTTPAPKPTPPSAPEKTPVVPSATDAANRAAASMREAQLGEELVSMRSMLEQVRRELRSVSDQSRAGHALQLAPAAASLYAHLITQGVEDGIAEELVRQAASTTNGTPATLFAQAHQLVAERMGSARAPWLKDRPRVVALVGPTGIGKTTTLAKIAAKALMESQVKIALITVDTYRVGARDQIARYGQIMNVPTHVATTRAELQRAVERCASAELVLIDTAGRSLSEAIAQQAELIRSINDVQLYLCMSAATGHRELTAVAERYRHLKPDRLVFTKLDEAVGPGSILSAAVRLGMPVSCIANGQRVPEDIHALSSQQLAETVIGDWSAAPTNSAVAGRK